MGVALSHIVEIFRKDRYGAYLLNKYHTMDLNYRAFWLH